MTYEEICKVIDDFETATENYFKMLGELDCKEPITEEQYETILGKITKLHINLHAIQKSL